MENGTLSKTLELTTEELIKIAVDNGEGVIASNGALSLETGDRTGRSPNDRFIVKEESTSKYPSGDHKLGFDQRGDAEDRFVYPQQCYHPMQINQPQELKIF